MTYHTYIIESECSGKWYYGHTSELEKRLKNHNSGKSQFTKNKGPWTLIFKREFESKSEAIKFELALKRLRNKKYIREKFATFFAANL